MPQRLECVTSEIQSHANFHSSPLLLMVYVENFYFLIRKQLGFIFHINNRNLYINKLNLIYFCMRNVSHSSLSAVFHLYKCPFKTITFKLNLTMKYNL